ncbi:hypothetical protein HAX54_039025 [Datura stramonium]|uniref:Uncharacterized protein n=1 Tax=Datura stramonium TaxID=4076 RepID=A0ABS8VP14_DATST|nr:hypothetical protein [Datura stramonium]
MKSGGKIKKDKKDISQHSVVEESDLNIENDENKEGIHSKEEDTYREVPNSSPQGNREEENQTNKNSHEANSQDSTNNYPTVEEQGRNTHKVIDKAPTDHQNKAIQINDITMSSSVPSIIKNQPTINLVVDISCDEMKKHTNDPPTLGNIDKGSQVNEETKDI